MIRVARRRLRKHEANKLPLQIPGLIGIEVDENSVLRGFFLQHRSSDIDPATGVFAWVDVPVVDIPDEATSPAPAKQRLDEGDKPA